MADTVDREAFWQDVHDEQKWRAASRQMVRFLLMEGLPTCEAIAEAIRISRARGAVLEELRDMATEI